VIIKRKDGRRGTMTFGEFARDHGEHAHCCGCGHCIIDPSDAVRYSTPIWCVGCRDRHKTLAPPGTKPPWLWEVK